MRDDRVKDWWNETADYFQDEAEVPVAVQYGPGSSPDDRPGLIDDVDDLDVLEMGCGGGQFGVALAEQGANVVGIDASEEQLRHARQLAAERGVDVDFRLDDVVQMETVDDSKFDLVVSVYVFQWVADLDACFEQARRVLRPEGEFVFSLTHPVYQRFDGYTGEFHRSYFDTGEEVREEEGVDADMVRYHHTVSGIHNSLVDAGFTVKRMAEPGSTNPEQYEEKFGFKPEWMAVIPPTIAFRALLAEGT